MPRSNKASAQKAEPAEDTQKRYARAFASRLAKEVGEDVEISRRSTTPRKKPASKKP